MEWASDRGDVAMISGTLVDWSNDLTQSWKTIKWSKLGLILPLDQMIASNYMLPRGKH